MTEEDQFTRLHDLGVKQFGSAWLTANRHVKNVAITQGLDPKTHRLFLSLMAYSICYSKKSPFLPALYLGLRGLK